MINVDKKYFCYSVFSPEYDFNSLELGLLSKVRSDFFNLNKKQKNQIVKEVNGKKYHYFYSLENGKPAKWKKVLNGKVLEKSRLNKDGTYSILYQDEIKNLLKISYFNNNHDWLKTEYFKDKGKTVFKRSKNDLKILVYEYKNGSKNVVEYEIYPHIQKTGVFDNNSVKLCCLTNFGRLSYLIKKQIDEIKKIKKFEADESLTDKKKNYVNEVKSVNKKSNDFKSFFNYNKIIKTDENEIYYYFGNISEDLRNGFGKTVAKSGKTTYEGFYKNDKRDGFGIQYYKSGKVCYTGNFLENERNNLGVAFNELGNIAQVAIWKNGKPNKFSMFFNESGNISVLKNELDDKKLELISYSPEIKYIKVKSLNDNKITLLDENGLLLYNGQVNNNLKNGFGTEYKSDGSIKYRGDFKNDFYNGYGTIFLENENRIDGNFLNGKINGFAKEFNNKGQKVYEGEFKDNLYDGNGKLYSSNASFIEGTFKLGELTGTAKKINENNQVIYEGNFLNNKYSGHGSLFINDNKIYEGDFKNNFYNGFGRIFDNGKCIYSGNFKDSKKFGFGTSFNYIGQKRYVGQWEENRYNGNGVLFEDDGIIYIGNFKDSKKSGRLNVVYNGQIIKEGIFEDDKLVYVKEYTYPGKSVSYIGNICNNKKCGMGCQFNEYGEKEFEGIFEDGKITTNMRVPLKNIEDLPESDIMKNTEYEKFRVGINFAVEKNILDGIYSGEILMDKPNGKGTMLYSDHRYIGNFSNGLPNGYGIIYKNNGVKIEGNFFESPVNDSNFISFNSGLSYNCVEIK